MQLPCSQSAPVLFSLLFPVTSKKRNRVGRSLLFIFFPQILPRNTTDALFALSIYRKGVFFGYLLTMQNAYSTVKAFHRMNLYQKKCLNSNTASNMTAKVAKPIKDGRKG